MHEKENFQNYIKDISESNNDLKVFCSELNKLNRSDTNIVLMKKYNKSLIDRKNKEIKYLKNEIDKLYLTRLNREIENNKKFRMNKQNKIKKQIQAVDLAKQNIMNKDKLDINII